MYKILHGMPGEENKKTIGTAETRAQAEKIVADFINKEFPDCCRYRCWSLDGGKTTNIDYGSHEKYIYIIEEE